MPLYEYECESCQRRFEKIQKFSDPLVEVCPHCGGRVRKLLSSPAIKFKGSGWYITDYAKKESSSGGDETKSSAATEKADGSKSDGGKSDTAGSTSTSSTESGPKKDTTTS